MRTLLLKVLKRKSFAAIAIAVAAVIVSLGAIAPAFAVPPTVTPSPGYDARLAEQRRAAEVQAPAHARKPLPRPPAQRRRYSY
ncbi:hypothetical protein [Tardiphaga sp. P5_C7]